MFSPQITGGAGPSDGITGTANFRNFTLSTIFSSGLTYEGVAETLTHNRVGVLHHGVHGVGEVVLQRPRQTEGLEVQPEFADGGVAGAEVEVAGALGGGVEAEVGDVLAGLSSAPDIKHAADAEAVSAASPGLPAHGRALAGGEAGPVTAQAGLALRVGELHHREHVQQPGAN